MDDGWASNCVKEHAAGASTKELYRRLGIADETLYTVVSVDKVRVTLPV